jgi:UDP-3-O-[3-hydroxymyristoyl] glucosamine N-acyltransferase
MNEQQSKFTAASLARRLGGRLVGRGEMPIAGVNALDEATGDEITFIADHRHARLWGASRAGAAVVTEGLDPAGHDPQKRALIHVPDAELAMASLLELFQPAEALPEVGVHPTAWVHELARLGRDVRIGPHVSVEADCVIEDNVILNAGVRLYPQVTIGAGSILHANCVVRSRCRLGRAVILHQNVSIGADGFGYRPAADGQGLVKIPHIGTVVIEDGVEIGAGSCVDRAKFGSTVIGAGTKIDNLVQIAHNCRIGPGSVIAGLTAVAGSVTIGQGVVIAGCVGISDHVRIGDGARIGGGSGVTRDIPAGETWLGYPAFPAGETLRQWATIRKLPSLIQRISRHAEGEGRPPELHSASD